MPAPQAPPPHDTPPPQWEYLQERVLYHELAAMANLHAAEGWRAIAFHFAAGIEKSTIIFERPHAPAAP